MNVLSGFRGMKPPQLEDLLSAICQTFLKNIEQKTQRVRGSIAHVLCHVFFALQPQR